MFGISSGRLDHPSPAYHLATRGNGRAGVPMRLTDAPLEALQSLWFAADGLTAQQAVAAQIQARRCRSAPNPRAADASSSAPGGGTWGVLPGLPLFTNVRRV